MNRNQNLIFDIDLDEINAISQQIAATPKEVQKAYGRALKRTAVTIQKLSRQLIKQKLQVKSPKVIRKRLKQFQVKKSGNSLGELKLWFGLDPLPISALKGRVKRTGTKSKPLGASFNPASSQLNAKTFSKGFIAKAFKSRSIFTRTGKGRWAIKEELIDIEDALLAEIEDDIFEKLPEIFFHHFEVDLKGRVATR